jgi:hypothetical protein
MIKKLMITIITQMHRKAGFPQKYLQMLSSSLIFLAAIMFTICSQMNRLKMKVK